MDNVIFILIDSVFSECLSNNRTDESSTPFIDSLVSESLFANNVYSYAPYTDAATIGLYCGIPTLEKLGYFYGINLAEHNHFKLFSEQGYETFGLYYPYYLLSSKTKQYVDNVIYTGGFKYGSVWGGKLEYYAKERKKRQLTEQEYILLEKCMDLVFDCWLTFYRDLHNSDTSKIIVRDLKISEIKAIGEKGIKEEYEKYLSAKRNYIEELMDQGMTHRMANINDYDFGKKSQKQFLTEIYSQNRKFFNQVQRMNVRRNLANNFPNIRKIFTAVKKLLIDQDNSYLRYFVNYGMLLAGCKFMERQSLGKKDWQEIASLNKQVEAMFEALKNRDPNKPFYASLHVLEPHHNISFFSFDSFNQDLIRNELQYLEPLVKNCGKKFAGNLLYQLSLRYVDYCIKKMFERLSKEDLINNTTVVLVADHGTSYTFKPTRTKVVNTFHKENYNIPLMIWSKNLPIAAKDKFSGFYSSEDILPTLCKTVGLNIPQDYKGKIIYEDKCGRPYVITEYMGPGVPDMVSREVWISIRNDKYVIAYKNKISKPLKKNKPVIIYDLVNDKFEEKNYANKLNIINSPEICYLIDRLEIRYNEIRIKTHGILNNLNLLEV